MLMQKAAEIDEAVDFIYGYLILKSYIFRLKTKVQETTYPNEDYASLWRDFLNGVDFKELLSDAVGRISNPVDGGIIDIYDTMDRASYFALIHAQHPNITLGFIKDADLWNIWLENGIYKAARETIADLLEIGKGDKIIDFGCGSASPPFYAEIVGYTGYYGGIDLSKSMLNIAETKVRNLGLYEWVNLKLDSVDAKQEFKRKYDIAIISSVLEYIGSIKGVLRNSLEAIDYEGEIVVFSELFSDIEPEKINIFKLYYSLIPSFNGFPSVSGILEILYEMGVSYSHRLIGKHILLIDVEGK
jgi:ubiquinone/menaquinone biosynthesis C-methylase UbiE